MTATTTPQTRERDRVRAEIAATLQRIHAAADALDPAETIAQARRLRSQLFHAQRAGIAPALLRPTPETDTTEGN